MAGKVRSPIEGKSKISYQIWRVAGKYGKLQDNMASDRKNKEGRLNLASDRKIWQEQDNMVSGRKNYRFLLNLTSGRKIWQEAG